MDLAYSETSPKATIRRGDWAGAQKSDGGTEFDWTACLKIKSIWKESKKNN